MVNKLEGRVKKVMAAVFGIQPSDIDSNTSQDSVEEWDSLKHMNLVIALEEEFDFEFTDSETVEILNYKLILEVLKDHGY